VGARINRGHSCSSATNTTASVSGSILAHVIRRVYISTRVTQLRAGSSPVYVAHIATGIELRADTRYFFPDGSIRRNVVGVQTIDAGC